MNINDPYVIVFATATLVVFSYIFDWISKKTNFPSVLLLLGVGIGLRWFFTTSQIEIPEVKEPLAIFGIIGLIMIVLEGALDLNITRNKVKLIYSSLFSALVILMGTSFLIAGIIQYYTHESFLISFINAVPFSVVSSAITIPSVSNLNHFKRDFLTYESTFSDILGIMLFNFVIVNEVINIHAFSAFFGELIILLIISIVSTLALMYFISAVKSHHKFFMIFALLMIIYSIGKMAHLSTLVLILFFGIVLNNNRLLQRLGPEKWNRFFDFPTLDIELKFLKSVTAEVAFLIRTIFFVIFGFSFDFALLMAPNVYIVGSLIVIAMLLIRFLYLRFTVRASILPEIFIAPRGLITILLFFSIPAGNEIADLGQGLLFYVIIVTNILMMFGLLIWKGNKNKNEITVSSIEEARSGNVNDDVIKELNDNMEESENMGHS